MHLSLPAHLKLEIYALIPELAFDGKIGLDCDSWNAFAEKVCGVASRVLLEIASCLDLDTLASWIRAMRKIQESLDTYDLIPDLVPALEVLIML